MIGSPHFVLNSEQNDDHRPKEHLNSRYLGFEGVLFKCTSIINIGKCPTNSRTDNKQFTNNDI